MVCGMRSMIRASVVVLGMAAPALAQSLYGATNGGGAGGLPGPATLYTVDPASGNATLVGSIGINSVMSIAFLPDGRLIGAATPDAGFTEKVELIEIDTTTGAGTVIGTVGTVSGGKCGRMPGMTYHGGLGQLLGYADGCFGSDPEGLYRIDPATGVGTSIGGSGFTLGGNGLAWDSATDTLYATPHDAGALVTLDAATSAATVVGGTLPAPIGALTIDPSSGELFGSLRTSMAGQPKTGDLIRIDKVTGLMTTVGPTGVYLDSLAFLPGGSCAVHNGGGGNPLDFDCADTPTVGQTWTSTVSTVPTVGSATNATFVAYGGGGPTQGLFVFGWELLILPPYNPIHQALGSHAIAIPSDPTLVGGTFTFQAGRAESTGPTLEIVLVNALDVTIGP